MPNETERETETAGLESWAKLQPQVRSSPLEWDGLRALEARCSRLQGWERRCLRREHRHERATGRTEPHAKSAARFRPIRRDAQVPRRPVRHAPVRARLRYRASIEETIQSVSRFLSLLSGALVQRQLWLPLPA